MWSTIHRLPSTTYYLQMKAILTDLLVLLHCKVMKYPCIIMPNNKMDFQINHHIIWKNLPARRAIMLARYTNCSSQQLNWINRVVRWYASYRYTFIFLEGYRCIIHRVATYFWKIVTPPFATKLPVVSHWDLEVTLVLSTRKQTAFRFLKHLIKYIGRFFYYLHDDIGHIVSQ